MAVPLKRHEALLKFSREHHFGLLLGWKIRQGISKSVSVKRMSAYVTASCPAEMWPHFENEEKDLFPLLDAGDPLRLKAEEEHRVIRHKLKELETDATIEKLEAFTKMVDDHIRFEERQLFPHIEQQQTFEAFAKAMEAHDKTPDAYFDRTWEDQFWK